MADDASDASDDFGDIDAPATVRRLRTKLFTSMDESDIEPSVARSPTGTNVDATVDASAASAVSAGATDAARRGGARAEPVQVYLRVRPLSTDEHARGESECVTIVSPQAIRVDAPVDSAARRAGGATGGRFVFSRVFDGATTQKQLFDQTTLPSLESFLWGANVLIFAYGVTNAGKTFTIQGTKRDGGVLPRALDVIFNSLDGAHSLLPREANEFDRSGLDGSANATTLTTAAGELASHLVGGPVQPIDATAAPASPEPHAAPPLAVPETPRVADRSALCVSGHFRYRVWMTYTEIYCEQLFDLLVPLTGTKPKREPLKFRPTGDGQLRVCGAREVQVCSWDEAARVLAAGQANRNVAETALNVNSSRSHSVLTIRLEGLPLDESGNEVTDEPALVRSNVFSFVDLAGSERYAKTQSTGQRLREASNINRSLMTLGKCLETLRWNQAHPTAAPRVVPFRESNLTRLFQDFYCRDGRVAMIVNVSPAGSEYDETAHVLKFSAVAKELTTVARAKVDSRRVPVPARKALVGEAGGGPAVGPARPPKRAGIAPVSGAAAAASARAAAEAALASDRLVDAQAVRMQIDGEPTGVANEADEWASDADVDADANDAGSDAEADANANANAAYAHSYESGSDAGSVEADVSDLLDEIAELRLRLVESEARAAHLEAEVRDEVSREMAERLADIQRSYEVQAACAADIHEEKYDRRLSIMRRSTVKRSADDAELRREVRVLRETLGDVREDRERVRSELRCKSGELAAATDELARTCTALESAASEQAAARHRETQLRQDVDTLTAALARETETRVRLEAEAVEYQGKLADLMHAALAHQPHHSPSVANTVAQLQDAARRKRLELAERDRKVAVRRERGEPQTPRRMRESLALRYLDTVLADELEPLAPSVEPPVEHAASVAVAPAPAAAAAAATAPAAAPASAARVCGVDESHTSDLNASSLADVSDVSAAAPHRAARGTKRKAAALVDENVAVTDAASSVLDESVGTRKRRKALDGKANESVNESGSARPLRPRRQAA